MEIIGIKFIFSIKGTKNANWRQTSFRPVWWPANISFDDPNNSKPRLSSEELHNIITAYSSYMVSVDAQGMDNEQDNNDNAGSDGDYGSDGQCSDENGRDRVGSTSGLDNIDTSNTGVPFTDQHVGNDDDEGAGDIGAGDIGAGDIGAGDIGAGDIGAGDIGAGDIGAGDVGAGDVGAEFSGCNDDGVALNIEGNGDGNTNNSVGGDRGENFGAGYATTSTTSEEGEPPEIAGIRNVFKVSVYQIRH